MSLQFYNSRTRQKDVFEPLDPSHVRMYVCGPTVYDRAHLGNARPVVVFDVLYRLLFHDFPRVTYVCNITDVDDKINDACTERGISIDELTRQTTAYYHADMAALNALKPTIEPRATAHIPEMIVMIERLIEKDMAYVRADHVLFRVDKFKDYGKLSKKTLKELLAGARVEKAPYKESDADFVLWKPSHQGQPGWESPWGWGRPGWHIECSAMSAKYLGEVFDIHGGGIDLIFPHHENEMAQSCAAHETDMMANFWMHNGHLMVNGQKMSKSVGNFFTVQDILANYPGEVIRLALLMVHYRQPLDWTDDFIAQAKSTLDKFYACIRPVEYSSIESFVSHDFLEILRDDINTPLAIAHLHQMVSGIHKATGVEQQKLASQFVACARFLGLLESCPHAWFQRDLDVELIQSKVDARMAAKKDRDFGKADALRQELDVLGIILEDTPQGTTWRRR